MDIPAPDSEVGPAWIPPTRWDQAPANGPADPWSHSAFGPPPGEQPPGPASGRSSLVTKGVTAAVAVAVGVGGLFGIEGATAHSHTAAAGGPGGRLPGGFPGRGFPGGGPGFPAAVGTIQAVNGSTITVTSRTGGSVRVTTSPATTVTKAAAGAISDMHIGDHVTVIGTGSSSTVAADRVVDTGTQTAQAPGAGAPGFGAGPAVSGTVTAASGGTVTVDDGSGTTVTVTTTPATTVTVLEPSTVAALAAGEPVVVTGTTSSDGTVAADTIAEDATGGGGRR